MVKEWESSVFHKSCAGDGRQRDVFPLPLLSNACPVNTPVCRAVRQRISRRHGKTVCVNKAIHALNSLFYGGSQKYQAVKVDNLSSLPEVQRFALKGIMDRIEELGPPPCASRSEALKVLRASAPSAYSELDLDTGSPVPMKLDSLSLPSGAVGGVQLLDALNGPVREMVENFEDFMLADPDRWNELTDVAASMPPYNDPLLNTRKGYLDFLERLYSSGVLNFSESCRGRVGAFSVSKKPKMVDGVKISRQRLVLDCRQTNLTFKAPPQTRLGSLASLGEAELPPGVELFAAGADIKDCFYAVNMEPGLQEFFGLQWNITDDEVLKVTGGKFSGYGTTNVPVIKVLPMGFSWSFYLVQHLHTDFALKSLGLDEKHLFLEGQPAPTLENESVCIMPYCDNVHSLCTNSNACQRAKDEMCVALEGIGFELHEHADACSFFETLGGVIDGKRGQVRSTNAKVWKIIHAFETAAFSRVDPKTIQRLLGHSMVLSVLNRCGMSVFRKLYDFSTSNSPPRFLSPSERDECEIFAGIAPLLIADLRREWSSTITCSDASPLGFGICERRVSPSVAKQHGRWSERWRFKRLPADQWKPRQRCEGRDVLTDVRTVVGSFEEESVEDVYVGNDDFPEVPDSLMDPQRWHTVKMGRWAHLGEHITLKEARSLLIAVRRLSRSSECRGKKHLVLLDNLALVFAATKGRAHSFDLLRVLQKISAICLAAQISLKPRWVRSEVNVADAPSRGKIQPGSGATSNTPSAETKQFLSHPALHESVNHLKRAAESAADREAAVPVSGAGKLAMQGKLTCLEMRSVSSEVQFQYKSYYQRFEAFSKASGLAWPLTPDVADMVLADYLDVLFLDKKGPAEGEKTLAAVEFFQIGLKHMLPRSRRALKGWRKVMPAQSRLPLPRVMMYGMSMMMIHQGEVQMAMMTMVAFDLYLRPGEALSLLGRNVIAPVAMAGSQFKTITVVVRDFESGQPDKVGTYDTSLKMDNPKTSWLGPLLLQLARGCRSQDECIFKFTMEEFRKQFQKVGSLLGVSDLHPYQLRHGGASEDLSSFVRDYQGVKSRGRWVTDQSVRRYAKTGRVQQLLTKLKPDKLAFCNWAERNMEKVLLGRIPPRTV
eukprot:s26_g81.t1